MAKIKTYHEWIKQADYDLGTAKAMLDAGRYIYSIFMIHLSIEKALKAIFAKKKNENPIRTHNLNYLVEIIDLDLPEEYKEFIEDLNNKSVPTRYPESLQNILKYYKKKETTEMYTNAQKLIKWLKKN
jgi:HEPN domain-containing protein